MAEPTPRQIEVLENMGIVPPPTKAACSSILGFIMQYRWSDLKRAEKIAYVKATQTKWLNKRVTATFVTTGEKITGTVNYLVCYSKGEIKEARYQGWKDAPFRVHIIPDRGGKVKTLFRLAAIEEIKEETP